MVESLSQTNTKLYQALKQRAESYNLQSAAYLAERGYQKSDSGLSDGKHFTRRLESPEDAEMIRSLIISDGRDPLPSHLFVMSPKGASAHIVYDKETVLPVAAAVGFLEVTQDDLSVRITHFAGPEEAVSLGMAAVKVDASSSGLTGGLEKDKVDISRTLINERLKTAELTEAQLLGLNYENNSYIAHLKNGETVKVRKPRDASDYKKIEEIEVEAWEQSDGDPDSNIVVREDELKQFNHPDNTMLIAEVDGEVVSFVFGFPGFNKKGNPVLYSHMAATLPSHQSTGVMQILKKAQIVETANLGLEEIRWTYDPSYDKQAANHPINLIKLGCIVDKYHIDPYSNKIQRGRYAEQGIIEQRPTDRFEVVQRLSNQDFINHITGIHKKKTLSVEEARHLPLANEQSTEHVLKYPIRDPNDSASDYILSLRRDVGGLLNQQTHVVDHVSTDFDKSTGKVSEAYFILTKV